ncbi:tyrosine-type recombinase/integrase [Variovorax sp. LjRoot178]|uniref:tyrosine-type recombinase/integrase n=1 Tax=Variovorax sp. LjRoot178 TaxID=3342277 RepID=UPI003ECF0A5F
MARTVTTSSAGSLPWLQNPLQAHKEWRSTLSWSHAGDESASDALYTDHSNKLYQSFWGKFCRWLAAKSLKLDQVKQAHIEDFLGSLRGRKNAPASVRTMRTYLAEINRVFTHLQAEGVLRANPAAVVLEGKRKKAESRIETDPPLPPGPTFLAAYEKMAARMFVEERAQLRQAGDRERPRKGWTPARNLALRLLVAECGLKLSEVCKLIPRNISFMDDGTVLIRSPGHRQVAARTVVGKRQLANALARWIEMRSELRIVRSRRAVAERARTSNRLFLGQVDIAQAADLVAGGLGAARSPIAPDLAERVVTSCVKRTLEELGHQAAFHGPQFVRNAYAARLIHRGMNDADVSDQLGMKTTFTARAIREKLQVL